MGKNKIITFSIIGVSVIIILIIMITAILSQLRSIQTTENKNVGEVNFSFETDTVITTKEKTLEDEIATLTGRKDNRRKNNSFSFNDFEERKETRNEEGAKYSSEKDFNIDFGKHKENRPKVRSNASTSKKITKNLSQEIEVQMPETVNNNLNQASQPQRISFRENSISTNATEIKSKQIFNGKFFEDVKVLGRDYAKIRVMTEFEIDGCKIKKNTILTALITKNTDRVDVTIQYVRGCGRNISTKYIGYSLDGTPGLFVRRDNIVETGVSEGGTVAIEETTDIISSTTGGVGGLIGRAVGRGISAASRKSTQEKPILIEEGREMIFTLN